MRLAFLTARCLASSRELLFVRVACGSGRTLALTGSGDVYSFGQGMFGALGHGATESFGAPVIVDSLWGLGIVQLRVSWGRGKYGQIGCGSVEKHLQPVPVTALSDRLLTQVLCGADYTMAIDSDGQRFSLGHGHWGQTLKITSLFQSWFARLKMTILSRQVRELVML
ncbi:ultraviolet-B receptor UVR8 [Selaginella moellendorffii]|uniref:ultraviolet-B receptor UVR8 n=1 Tax=Selaginella moellendorffii TaxID=88036 RepID=UPI000D1CAFEE|nr:ultraviolet-B receptor UVR8 [Selaginella moellendorffii]XP_024517466.1 ultraviolet-B receptor UVR8 [Selaginella moellendorffii]|eukprot:XP_024517465.1 ultraviolet-B receptor UVR8 [Selaginella moellendorffii]